MASFTFEAVDGKGNKVKKDVDASDRDDAMAKIKGMGLFPTKVKEKEAAAGGRLLLLHLGGEEAHALDLGHRVVAIARVDVLLDLVALAIDGFEGEGSHGHPLVRSLASRAALAVTDLRVTRPRTQRALGVSSAQWKTVSRTISSMVVMPS